MDIYRADVQYIFTGILHVKASSKEEAEKLFKENFGATLGRGMNHNLPDENEPNWAMDIHPAETKFSNIQIIQTFPDRNRVAV